MSAIRTKLLVAILTVLGVIAGVAIRVERKLQQPEIVVTQDDKKLQKKLLDKMTVPDKPYLVP